MGVLATKAYSLLILQRIILAQVRSAVGIGGWDSYWVAGLQMVYGVHVASVVVVAGTDI